MGGGFLYQKRDMISGYRQAALGGIGIMNNSNGSRLTYARLAPGQPARRRCRVGSGNSGLLQTPVDERRAPGGLICMCPKGGRGMIGDNPGIVNGAADLPLTDFLHGDSHPRRIGMAGRYGNSVRRTRDQALLQSRPGVGARNTVDAKAHDCLIKPHRSFRSRPEIAVGAQVRARFQKFVQQFLQMPNLRSLTAKT